MANLLQMVSALQKVEVLSGSSIATIDWWLMVN